VVILAGQYRIYKCFAEQIWAVCRRYADALETFLDEAYGCAGRTLGRYGSPEQLGRSLRRDIVEEVGLSVAIGLGPNRMLAKMAGKAGKPGGVVCVRAQQAEDFLAGKPVGDLPGVGPRTRRWLEELNIRTIGQMRRLSRQSLRAVWGARGELLYERCRGRDPQPIRADEDRLPRTISRETTFHEPVGDLAAIRSMLQYLLERAMRTVREQRLTARTVELALRYEDWRQVHCRRTLDAPTSLDEPMWRTVCDLLERLYTRRVSLRHVGVTLSGFARENAQPTLFADPDAKPRELHAAMDAIRDRWGHKAVVSGDSIGLLGELNQNDHGFVLRTPSLTK
jgi:DNA polymerase-4